MKSFLQRVITSSCSYRNSEYPLDVSFVESKARAIIDMNCIPHQEALLDRILLLWIR
jgi:hypothetical protein